MRNWPRLVVTLMAALVVTTQAGAAQERHVIRGVVQDSLTSKPIASAWLEVQGSAVRVMADDFGRFQLQLAGGSHDIVVYAWGYERAERLIVTPDSHSVVIRMSPRPLTAAPIIAAAETSISQRRRAVAWSVRVLSLEDLQQSRALDATGALSRRHLTLVPCGRGRPECIRRRMQYVRPIICVDEQLLPGGIAELRNYPASMFHTIEVHDGGAVIRGYTIRFMDHLASGQLTVMPVLFRDRC